MLRILVYEHITGGGLVDELLPPSLAREGELMLRALVDDLTALPGVAVVVTRDARLAALPAPVHTLFVHAGETLEGILQRGLACADLAWPIAPESGGILERVCRFIESAKGTLNSPSPRPGYCRIDGKPGSRRLTALDSGFRRNDETATDRHFRELRANGLGTPLLGCSSAAVRIATSKIATAELLAAAGIAVVPTTRDPALLPADVDAIVIKPDDGAGCLDTRLHTRESARRWWATHAHDGHVAQPFVAGEAISLSLLCAGNEAQVLACNRQHVRAVDGVFAFTGVSVNASPAGRARHAALAGRIAQALPGLWGYVGVDLIETPAGPLVVEVNPRLTTAYAGLRRALGINAAALVLGLRRPDAWPGAERWAEIPAGVGIDIETHDDA